MGISISMFGFRGMTRRRWTMWCAQQRTLLYLGGPGNVILTEEDEWFIMVYIRVYHHFPEFQWLWYTVHPICRHTLIISSWL